MTYLMTLTYRHTVARMVRKLPQHRSPWTRLVTQTPPSATLSRRTCRLSASRPPGAGHRDHGCRLGALAASVLGVVVLAVAACGSGQAAAPSAVTRPSPRVCTSESPSPGWPRSVQILDCNDNDNDYTVIISSQGVTAPRVSKPVYVIRRVPVPGFARCLARHGVIGTLPGGKHKFSRAQAAAFTACSTPIQPPAESSPRGR
jgi:hypothetical protein